jgi:hypothetical protein
MVPSVYLIYVDDSGDERRTLFCALAIPEHRWSSYLKGWLTWRRQLFRDEGIPAGYELHAQNWLASRTLPLPDTTADAQPPILGRNRDARRRRFDAFESAFAVMGTFAEALIYTIAVDTTSKHPLYASLLAWLNDDLTDRGARGILVLDGLDQGHQFRRRHRDLDLRTRRIIEDPIPCPSHESQLIQMADFCAHAAFRGIRGTDPRPVVELYRRRLARLIVPGSEAADGVRWVKSTQAPG